MRPNRAKMQRPRPNEASLTADCWSALTLLVVAAVRVTAAWLLALALLLAASGSKPRPFIACRQLQLAFGCFKGF